MQLTPLAFVGAEPTPSHSSARAPDNQERNIKYWWDPMLSPPYISDRPGKSPMGGMDLIPVYEDEVSAGTAVTIDPTIVQNMGVRVAEVTRGPIRRSIRLFGHLEEAQPAIHDINLRVTGWVRKLHADTEGMLLRVGDPLFDLYSPDLQVAIGELVIVARPSRSPHLGGESTETLIHAARTKLELLGITTQQIKRFAELDRAPETVTFTSPITGYLTEKSIVTGAAVKEGDRVMRIVDQSVLWLDTRAFEQHMSFLALGQKAMATFASRPGEDFEGQIVFIAPRVDPMTRSAVVRFAIPNPSLSLRPGMYATANLIAELAEDAVIVPREAVIDTGTNRVAFVSDKIGRFEPRRVTIGFPADDGMVQVLSGLAPGEKVVVSGQFLLDTESRLREAIQKYRYEKQRSSVAMFSEQRGPVSGESTGKPLPWSPQTDSLFATYLEVVEQLGTVQQTAAPIDVSRLVAAAGAMHGEIKDVSADSIVESIARDVQALRDQSIERQRELFRRLSDAIAKLAERSPPSSAVAPRLHVMYCPMAPGHWLQRTRSFANPFYATEMKQCAELVKTIELAARNGS
jgi:hypothetical protein